jgi:hypothetical protein
MTLSDAVLVYRSLNEQQRLHYRDLNYVIRFESRFVFLYPLLVLVALQILRNPTSHWLVSIGGGAWTARALYLLCQAYFTRKQFEERHGLTTHQKAIRKFNLQNL